MLANIPYSLSIMSLLVILTAATWTDCKSHRIPNVLTLGGLALGLALQAWGFGLEGLLAGLGGIGVGLLLLLPFYALGGMAAGDVKLMATVGAFVGLSNIVPAVAATLIAGGVLGVLVLLQRRGALAACRRYASTLKYLWATGKVSWVPPAPGEAAATPFPYALAILTGTVAALWWLGHFNPLLGA